ncbi:NYN domain-containing protein [Sedimentisphaera salicampi]|uniref:NYN domain-containing protein n=1 Tax=Sedimentisphaera salicampi TaxID=1941349 RepID=UPI000B9D239D|nr:NYN domain-containing protein [Sedimentisphaera salicampi]OXU14133.1 putative RNA-binding protein containing a PIN domain protein [Sedimentisphaera salicampi]
MRYLIDGHNLVFAMKNSGEQLAGFEVHHAADLLCKALESYLVKRNERAVLYFDGTGPIDKSFYNCLSNVEVCFSGEDYEADDFLVEDIEDDSGPSSLVVVSNDRQVRDAARRSKALIKLSNDFWLDLVEDINRKPPKKKEPEAKRKGIDPCEVDQWLDYFGIDE